MVVVFAKTEENALESSKSSVSAEPPLISFIRFDMKLPIRETKVLQERPDIHSAGQFRQDVAENCSIVMWIIADGHLRPPTLKL